MHANLRENEIWLIMKLMRLGTEYASVLKSLKGN